MIHTNRKPRVDTVYDFRRETKKKGTLGTVHVRVYYQRKRTYISTDVRVAPAEYMEGVGVVNRPDAAMLNAKIARVKKQVVAQLTESLRNNHPLPTGEICKQHAQEAGFLDWLEAVTKKQKVKESTRKHYTTLLNALEQYGKIKNFRDVTSANINAFLDHVATFTKVGEAKPIPIAQTTIYNYYKWTVKFVRIAIAEHLVSPTALDDVSCDPGESKPRVHLTAQELTKLLTATGLRPGLSRVRDLFILQCSTGLAYKDLMEADYNNIQYSGNIAFISGRRIKTSKNYFLVVLPDGINVLKKHNFAPPRMSLQHYNEQLKELMRIVGINKHITTHCGRHTYAVQCLLHKISLPALQRTLGHRKLTTTQIYLQLVDNEVLDDFAASFAPDTPAE